VASPATSAPIIPTLAFNSTCQSPTPSSVQTIIPLGSGNGALRLTTEELKARTKASLRGHFKAQGDEQTGSQSYIPPDPKDDKALHTALDLIRGIQKNLSCLNLQALPCP
jgi:hypothetical protein